MADSEESFAITATGADVVREAPVHRPAAVLDQILPFLHQGAVTLNLSLDNAMTSSALRGAGFEVVRRSLGLQPLESLKGLPDESCRNIVCADTLSCLPREHLISYALELGRLLDADGRLAVSVVTQRAPLDSSSGEKLPVGKLILLLESAGFHCVQRITDSFSSWLLLKKVSTGAGGGLETVQSILAQDAKFATYKYALIRALAVISRTEPNSAEWRPDGIYIPLYALAVRWLVFYWPLLTHPTFIAQNRSGESNKKLAFREHIDHLRDRYGAGGLYDLLQDIDEDPMSFRPALKRISSTIESGPIAYSGTGTAGIFRKAGTIDGKAGKGLLNLGWIVVPEPLWLSITRFEHWIEDSIVVRWSQLTAEMNRTDDAGLYLGLLLRTPDAERDTQEVRRLLRGALLQPECVWSGKTLGAKFDIDHTIPYSVWRNNDLWNLLPCDAKLNNQKRDRLPSARLLLQSRDRIVEYWRTYNSRAPRLFGPQAQRALGSSAPAPNWEVQAFTGLQENVERLAVARGLPRWSP